MSDNNCYPFSDEMGDILSRGTVILFVCDSAEGLPLLSVSGNVKKILGFSSSYLLDREHRWSDRIHPDDKPHVFESVNKVASDGAGTVSEYRFRRKDGTYIWLRSELSLAEEDNGAGKIHGLSFDITERKEKELALQKSQQRYQSIFDHINDITYSLDRKGNIRLLNASWTERTGHSVESSTGTPFWDYVHPKDQEGVKRFLNSLIESQGAAEKILRIATAKGDFYWAEVYAKCLTAGNEYQVNGTITDISNKLVHLDKKEEINQQLNERVAQHTQELRTKIEKQRRTETNIQQQLSYEQAISQCSNLLLESSSPKALKESLEIMREVTNADRAYVYKNFKTDGELRMRLAVEACAENILPNTQPKPSTQFSYSEAPWWHEQLSNKNIINTHIEDLPETERKLLGAQGLKSILAIPIRIKEEWYGYIGFSNVINKRTWQKHEIQFLETAANIISAYEKRKQIEKSLIEQQDYTEAILDSLPSIYLLMDEDLGIQQWNYNAKEYTGYTAEELNRLDVFDLVVEEDHDELRKGIKRARANNDEGRELRLLTKEGKIIPYYWRGRHIELNQQECFLCIGINITQQKETEKKLLDEKRFNEALLESLPGTFYMFDEEGNYQRWNQNLIKDMGYSAEELKQMNPMNFFDERDHKKAEGAIQQVFEEGKTTVELNCITKDGTSIPYMLSANLFSNDGKDYLLGVGYDISEQVKVRRERRRNEELFKNLFLKAPAAIAMIDPDNKIQSVNQSFEQLFGYQEQKLIDKDIDEMLVPKEQRDDAPKFSDNQFFEKKTYKQSQRLTKGGELIDVFVAPIPVYIDDDLIASFGMYIDISEQKKYEEELQKSLEDKKMLLKEIHHRIKNNLAVVNGLIQLQIFKTENSEVKATLKESESRIQTIASIHEKIYYSRTLSGVSCKEYIGDLVESISATNEVEKKVTISKDIDDIHLNTSQAVPFALLVNEVVTNSFKYAFEDQDEGEIKIEISKKGDELRALIRDNGKGLPDDFAEKNADSLGMTLIENFMKQLKAKGSIKNDEGTCLDLSFEIEKPITES